MPLNNALFVIYLRTAMRANDSSVLPGSSLEMILAHKSKVDDGVKRNPENYSL